MIDIPQPTDRQFQHPNILFLFFYSIKKGDLRCPILLKPALPCSMNLLQLVRQFAVLTILAKSALAEAGMQGAKIATLEVLTKQW